MTEQQNSKKNNRQAGDGGMVRPEIDKDEQKRDSGFISNEAQRSLFD